LPEFHADWLRPPPAPPPGHFIAAVMLFPHDEKLREAFLLAEFVADAARYGRLTNGSSLDGKNPVWLYDTPKQRELINDRRLKAIHASGRFAAWALCYVLQAIADGQPEIASINSAYDVALAKPGARREKTLKNSWSDYSCVAHLWLAYLAGIAGDFCPWGDRHGDWEVLTRWLACAEYMRRQGEEWEHLNAKKPVLDPAKTWKVPAGFELPSFRVHIELALLEKILELEQG
jgi:hypothetical protein